MRCKLNAEAVLVLESHGMEEEASPLRRSVVEHVVGLRWLHARGNEAVDVVRRGNARERLSTRPWKSCGLLAD
jgi:hypothetical protein